MQEAIQDNKASSRTMRNGHTNTEFTKKKDDKQLLEEQVGTEKNNHHLICEVCPLHVKHYISDIH